MQEYKKCTKCNIDKILDDFWWKNKAKSIKQPLCKVCTLKYQKVHYKKSSKRRKKISEANFIVKERNRIWILDYLLLHSCVDCGEMDLRVLDFDHVERSTKFMTVAKMVTGCWSLNKIKEEIAKCVVRCANCHRKRTAIQFEWRKATYKQDKELEKMLISTAK